MQFRLQQYREEKGLSQVALAKQTGLTQGFISQIEHGKKIPTVYIAKKLSLAVGKSLDELVEL